jgi:hypothetical protein
MLSLKPTESDLGREWRVLGLFFYHAFCLGIEEFVYALSIKHTEGEFFKLANRQIGQPPFQ